MRTTKDPNLSLLALAGASLLAALLAILLATPNPASAHGSVSDPPSRTYTCRFVATDTGACSRAWAANPQALYDWMEVNIGDAAGQHQAKIPNGKLCSAGRAKYAAFDEPAADWPTTALSPNADGRYSISYEATAPHATEYFRLYITRADYRPTQPLGWNDLDLVYDSGPLSAQPTYRFNVSLPARSGHHILYQVWQRSDSPEAFYSCSDVTLGGAGATPTTAPPSTVAPTTSSTASTTVPTTARPTTEAPATSAPTTTASTSGSKPTSTSPAGPATSGSVPSSTDQPSESSSTSVGAAGATDSSTTSTAAASDSTGTSSGPNAGAVLNDPPDGPSSGVSLVEPAPGSESDAASVQGLSSSGAELEVNNDELAAGFSETDGNQRSQFPLLILGVVLGLAAALLATIAKRQRWFDLLPGRQTSRPQARPDSGSSAAGPKTSQWRQQPEWTKPERA